VKLKKLLSKTLSVKVVNDPLDVGVKAKPFLVTIFDDKEVEPRSSTMGPLGGLDLTGYSEYRLTLHFVGEEGTPFSIEEMFGPAGAVDQIRFEIDSGRIGSQGILNYRGVFEIFGPRNLFIQIANHGDAPFQVNGTLYAVR
jgi:hypothetical protein